MKKTLAVARWEYVEKMKSKAFIVSLLLMPLIMIAAGMVPTLLVSRADSASSVIGIIDQSGVIAAPLTKLLDDHYRLPDGRPNYILRPIAVGPTVNVAAAKREADSMVMSQAIEGYLVIGQSVLTDSSVEYRSQNIGNLRLTERLMSSVRDLVVEMKLRSRGLDTTLVREMTSPMELRTIKLSKSGQEEESGFERVFFTSFIFLMMMFFPVVTSSQLLVRSMLEEKSNRVIEVLMSSGSANELMAGKIIGLSGLGLTQLAFWVAIGAAVSARFAVTLIPPVAALLFFVYFILGYLLYAAIFVAAGAPVSTEQEAQQITSYLVMILVIPIVFSFMVIQNPNSDLVKVMSFVPVLTPSMMAMRIAISMPSLLELVASMLLLAASAVGAIWVAGKIFRTTILVYGKRPNLKELVGLLRAH